MIVKGKERHLFNNWDKLKKRLDNKCIFLFFDYDGTLVPITDSPGKAVMPSEVKELLKQLLRIKGCKVAIISGRSLKNIKEIIGLKGVIYSGNHGLEIEAPGVNFDNQVSLRLKAIIRHIKEELSVRLPDIRGVFVEDKGLIVSVHYRLVDKDRIHMLRKILKEITNPYIVRGKVKIDHGKEVYEIKPPVDWNKGKIISWILSKSKRLKAFPIYLGDDVTDEDAFMALKNKGLTIFVGRKGESIAQFYLKDASEVYEFIRRIIKLRKIKYGRCDKS